MKIILKFGLLAVVIFFCVQMFLVLRKGKQAVPSHAQPQEEWKTRVRDLRTRNLKKDFKDAILKNDLCFKGINEYSTAIPGVEAYYSNLPGRKCVKIIEGTGDAITSDEHGMFQDSARHYAAAYNKLLLEYIESQMSQKEIRDWRAHKEKLDSSDKHQRLIRLTGEREKKASD